MAADRAAYEWLATQPPGPMIELPLGEPDPAVRYQFRTLIHGNRIVNGYSGYGSALQDFLRGPPSTEGGAAGDQLAMFRALGLRYVVIHGQLYADPAIARDLVDEMRAQTEHVARVTTRGPVTIVELRPGASGGLPQAGRRRDPARVAHAVRLAQRSLRCRWPSTATTRRGG